MKQATLPLFEPKTPAAMRVYGFDWTDDLAAGETITTSTWAMNSDLAPMNEAIDDYTTSVKIGGGKVGGRYRITNKIITSVGVETAEKSAMLEIVQAR